MTLDAGSRTLEGLPRVLSRGLVAVSFFGLLSFLSSAALFLFLTWKIVRWRLKSDGQTPINQFLFLIYNLLFADIQQALAFLLNISHLRQNSIVVGDTTCWAQGWFVSTGDLASTRMYFPRDSDSPLCWLSHEHYLIRSLSLSRQDNSWRTILFQIWLSCSVFIFAIGVHTFLAVVKDYRLPTWAFYSSITSLWIFNYVLGLIGPIKYGKDFYVRANAWVILSPRCSPSFTNTYGSAGSILSTSLNASGFTTCGSSYSCLARSFSIY